MVRDPARLQQLAAAYNMEGAVLDERRENGDSVTAIVAFMSQKAQQSKL